MDDPLTPLGLNGQQTRSPLLSRLTRSETPRARLVKSIVYSHILPEVLKAKRRGHLDTPPVATSDTRAEPARQD